MGNFSPSHSGCQVKHLSATKLIILLTVLLESINRFSNAIALHHNNYVNCPVDFKFQKFWVTSRSPGLNQWVSRLLGCHDCYLVSTLISFIYSPNTEYFMVAI